MTRQQVGWYDGSRVHQMHVRPVGDVPRHLAHTASWKPAYVEDAGPAVPGSACPDCTNGLVDVSGHGDFEACDECQGTGRTA